MLYPIRPNYANDPKRQETETMTTDTTTIDPAELMAWLYEQTWSDFGQSLWRQYDRSGSLSPKQWAAAVSMKERSDARQANRAAAKPPVDDPEIGFYWDANAQQIVRVQIAKTTGRPYAKTLDVHDGRSLGWKYVGRSAFPRCTPETRYTIEQAKAWGLAHGWCLVCGRELTDPKSVDAGIGPVCARKF